MTTVTIDRRQVLSVALRVSRDSLFALLPCEEVVMVVRVVVKKWARDTSQCSTSDKKT